MIVADVSLGVTAIAVAESASIDFGISISNVFTDLTIVAGSEEQGITLLPLS